MLSKCIASHVLRHSVASFNYAVIRARESNVYTRAILSRHIINIKCNATYVFLKELIPHLRCKSAANCTAEYTNLLQVHDIFLMQKKKNFYRIMRDEITICTAFS